MVKLPKTTISDEVCLTGSISVKSPYPYFGGKSKIMPEVWKRLGDPPNLIDAFLGSNAPLLSRIGWDWSRGQWKDGKNRTETINDKNCFVSNFWRAINADPERVAKWADWPVNEADLHARHLWLVNNEDFIGRMKSDPDYYDAKIAGWWVWGMGQWIGSGWCSRKPAQQRPRLRIGGMGVHRVNQQRPHLRSAGMGVHRRSMKTGIYEYLNALSARLRRVRVCCGDWSRIMGPTPTESNGLTAIILDPPYGAKANRTENLYAEDDLSVADKVREWAIENGNNPKLRIALFGYADEHQSEIPRNWETLAWKARCGYSSQNSNGNDNPHKERVWFSPHCLKVDEHLQLSLLEIAI
jgi:site-specific DNA-adenine methylase